MLDQRSKSLIRALIYPIQFDRNPVDGVERVLKLVVEAGALGATPLEYLASTKAALASSEKLSKLIPQGHSEKVIRRYLMEIQQRLSSVRGLSSQSAGKHRVTPAIRLPEVSQNS
jgi:hypothetical protein